MNAARRFYRIGNYYINPSRVSHCLVQPRLIGKKWDLLVFLSSAKPHTINGTSWNNRDDVLTFAYDKEEDAHKQARTLLD